MMEVSLLHLASCLTFVQAEKVAVQLKVDQRHISMLRRVYMEDSEMFAYKLLQKWWDACELASEFEARCELSRALKLCDLGGFARTVLGEGHDGTEELSKSHMMSVMKSYNHTQVEHVAIALGIRQNVIDSLHRMYCDDSQLFGYHILLHWKNSSDTDPDEQQEQLQLALASTTISTSFPHCDNESLDDTETDNSCTNKSKPTSRSKCSSLCRWTVYFFLLLTLLVISLTSIPVLLTKPSLKDYSVLGQPGTSILFTISNYVTSFNLKIGSHAWCTGKAMTLDCSEITPSYKWNNVTERTYIYMTTGSVFQFKISSSLSAKEQASKSDSSFLWVFSDYATYATAMDGGFQGFNCNNPGNGNWCYETSSESNVNFVNYTTTQTNFYNIACFPDDACPQVKAMLIYQGSYSFDSFNSKPHSFVDLTVEKSVQINFRSQFDYSQKDKCVLVHVTDDDISTCSVEQSVQLLVSDQKRRNGLLLFPGLLIFILLILNLVYSLCFCYKIYRIKCNSHKKQNYELLTVASDV